MITEFHIENFRSLKDVTFECLPLSFFCGPNGSGKTNLAEALDFLSKTFNNGLSYAVAEKGGFYNICFRRERRTKGAIAFRVRGSELGGGRYPTGRKLDYEIEFSLRTKGEAIRSDFYVESERYAFNFDENGPDSWRIEFRRQGQKYLAILPETIPESATQFFPWLKSIDNIFEELIKPDDRELLYPTHLAGFFAFIPAILQPQHLRVFRLSPRFASVAGAPSVSGELGKYGENLPSALDYLYVHDRRAFEKLQHWVKDVVPDLEYLKTDYTQTRQMGLFMQEKGFGSQWYAEELSDGTLMSIALFLAILDSRYSCVFIEEPENSLHPWILRTFLECCREESQRKQVLITTQSPIVVATAEPRNLFLVERKEGKTDVQTAAQREPMIHSIINQRLLDLGEYWLSGGLKAVPGPPTIDTESLFREEE
jgi:predicted ATPase